MASIHAAKAYSLLLFGVTHLGEAAPSPITMRCTGIVYQPKFTFQNRWSQSRDLRRYLPNLTPREPYPMSVQSEASSQLREWQATFKRELTAHLLILRTEPDIFGYALEAPEDLGNLQLMTAIGRESKLAGEEPGSEYWISRRYSPVEWDGYVHDSTVYAESDARLESMQSHFAPVFFDDDCGFTPFGTRFQRSLHGACLDAMAQCDAEGAFGSIWFKVIVLSDGESTVVRKSFNRLNRGRARKEAYELYNGPGLIRNIRNFVWSVYARQVRRRRSRRKARQITK